MPSPLTLPYPPLVIIQSSSPITWPALHKVIEHRLANGVSICLVQDRGHEYRGGYFFHLRRTDRGLLLSTFDRPEVLEIATGEECASFINHVSGRKYDEKMWRLSQQVNLRTDAG